MWDEPARQGWKLSMMTIPVDSLLNYLAKNNITLIGHLGEPKDCGRPRQNDDEGNRATTPSIHYTCIAPRVSFLRGPDRCERSQLEKHPDDFSARIWAVWNGASMR